MTAITTERSKATHKEPKQRRPTKNKTEQSKITQKH